MASAASEICGLVFRLRAWTVVAASLLLTGCLTSDTVAAQTQWRWGDVERVVAIGDAHGADESFTRLLQAVELVDAHAQWAGGKAHLVVVGDAIDRGPGSRTILELLIGLQEQAAQSGGQVHFVLGNHEVMNLAGDLRYVSAPEYAAFTDMESAEQRTAAWLRYQASHAEEGGDAKLRGEFEHQYPAGFFGHRAAYATDGHLGQWLLKQPVMVTVNDTAFVHAGFAGRFASGDAGEVNRRFLKHLHGYVLSMNALIDAKILFPEDDFYEHPALLEARLGDGTAATTQTRTAAKNAIALNQGEFFASDSVVWYRGNVGCSDLIERGRFEAVLRALDVRRVAIGHTPTPGRRLQSRFDGQLLMIDTGMLKSAYKGRAAAVILVDDTVTALYLDDSQNSIDVWPRRVGSRPAMLTDKEIENILAAAPILKSTQLDNDRVLLQLRAGDQTIDAQFHRYGKKRPKFIPEVAAYRLDRLLGFDMVPVAMVREVGGRWGSVQFRPSGTVDEQTRAERRLGGGAWCPLRDQINAMYLFDALAYNERRTLQSMTYMPKNWQLISVDHAYTFNTKRGRPPHLLDVDVGVSADVASTLAALNKERLEHEMGDVLDARRIKALLKRRDELLAAR